MLRRPGLGSVGGFVGGLSLAIGGALVVQAWQTSAAPAGNDTTLVPITACRLIDTRPVPNRVGIIGTFSDDDTNVVSAHGSRGDCTIPTEAVGLSLNVTAVNATAPTYLTVWPDGVRPTASNLNPGPGQRPAPNAVVTPVTDSGTFNVYNRAGDVDVIIDVNGYYIDASKAFGQSFAVTAVTENMTLPDGDLGDYNIVDVDVAAPVDGQVTVHSATSVRTNGSSGITCWISTDMPGPDEGALDQTWRPASGSVGTVLAGTRLFDLSAGMTQRYHLNCSKFSEAGAVIFTDSVLTATFTPAPTP